MKTIVLTLFLLLGPIQVFAEEAEVNVSFSVSITSGYVKTLTGRSEGLLALFRRSTDLTLLISDAKGDSLAPSLAHTRLNYSNVNLLSIKAKGRSRLVLSLQIADGNEGLHSIGEVLLEDTADQTIKVVCDKNGVGITNASLEKPIQDKSGGRTTVRKESPALDPASAYIRLKQLNELFVSGIITTNEYETKRSVLVNEL